MFNNIGGKIKTLAKVIFIIEIVLAFIAGIAFMATDDSLIVVGLLVMVILPIAGWVSSWFLYGFGEIIDKLCEIERNTRGSNVIAKGGDANDYSANNANAYDNNNANAYQTEFNAYNTYSSQANAESKMSAEAERLQKIESLYARGLITEEEYQKAISKSL